jgi:hypothetical protein
MANTSAIYPTSAITSAVAPEDDQDWTNPTYIEADDGNTATCAALNPIAVYSYRLKAQSFDFSSIPAGSTIDGIVVEIEHRAPHGGPVTDYRVQLLDASGNLVGDNKASATAWGASYEVFTYGNSTDKWNASPTLAMLQDSDFGVVLSVYKGATYKSASVDYIRMTIYYTAPSGPTGVKTLEDLAIASVKTINDTAIASVKATNDMV